MLSQRGDGRKEVFRTRGFSFTFSYFVCFFFECVSEFACERERAALSTSLSHNKYAQGWQNKTITTNFIHYNLHHCVHEVQYALMSGCINRPIDGIGKSIFFKRFFLNNVKKISICIIHIKLTWLWFIYTYISFAIINTLSCNMHFSIKI